MGWLVVETCKLTREFGLSRYTNSLVARQLQKQVNEENALQKSIIIMQQNSEHFEEGVVRAIQMAWATFDEWK